MTVKPLENLAKICIYFFYENNDDGPNSRQIIPFLSSHRLICGKYFSLESNKKRGRKQ